MNVLGFDTATPTTAVGLETGGAVTQSHDTVAPAERGHHAESLLVQARVLLEAAGLDWSELDLIAVGVGPGGYTGLRIGLATARGLALAHGARLVGVGTLTALAEPVGGRLAISVLDARRSELFVAAYLDDVEVLAPRVIPAEQLRQELTAIDLPGALALGDGALAHRAGLEALGIEVAPQSSELHRISGAAVCRLAARAASGSAVPRYLRRPDAEIALTEANR